MKTRHNPTPKTPVVATAKGDNPITSHHQIHRLIRQHLPKHLNARPYILRSYFAYALLGARVHEKWQHFFMGHTGDIEATYTTKKHIPEHLIQPMREAFKPAEQLLTTQTKPDLDDEKKEIVKRIAHLILGPQELEIQYKTRNS